MDSYLLGRPCTVLHIQGSGPLSRNTSAGRTVTPEAVHGVAWGRETCHKHALLHSYLQWLCAEKTRITLLTQPLIHQVLK